MSVFQKKHASIALSLLLLMLVKTVLCKGDEHAANSLIQQQLSSVSTELFSDINSCTRGPHTKSKRLASGTCLTSSDSTSTSVSCTANASFCLLLADCSDQESAVNMNMPTGLVPCNTCHEPSQSWIQCSEDGSAATVFTCGCEKKANCTSSFSPPLGDLCPHAFLCANGDSTMCPVAIRRCPTFVTVRRFSDSKCSPSAVVQRSSHMSDTCLSGGVIHRCLEPVREEQYLQRRFEMENFGTTSAGTPQPQATPEPTTPAPTTRRPKLRKTVSFSKSEPFSASTTNTNIGLIIGASVGGGLGLIVIVAVVFWFVRIRPRSRVKQVDGEDPSGPENEDGSPTSQRIDVSGTIDSGPATIAAVVQSKVASPKDVKGGLAKFAGYEKLNLVGRGANGSVFRCSLPSGKLFALKEILLPTNSPADFLDLIMKEVALVTSLDHPNLVKYYASSVDQKNGTANIFMEFIPNGSLGSMIRQMPEPMGEALASKYLRQVLLGLQYLHEKSVMHRDIKCDNVLLANDGSAKITDFGAAKLVGADTMRGAQTMIGTPFFMAPEMLVGGCGDDDEEALLYGKRADIWSLGIMTLELLEKGNMPWPNMQNIGQLILYISGDDAHPIIPDRLSAEAKDFILKCCERSPQSRWRASELLQHPWIANHAPNDLEPVESLSTM